MLNMARNYTNVPKTMFDDIKKINDCLVIQKEPLRIIKEDTVNSISFNVMPNLPVEEKLYIKEYRVWERYIEAIFDRDYTSTMEKSPNHLIFLTALVHLQKILYVFACHEFNLEYNPHESEKVKIWPTVVNINMPKLITKSRDIKHRVFITDICKRNEKSYYLSSYTIIENVLSIFGEAVVYII